MILTPRSVPGKRRGLAKRPAQRPRLDGALGGLFGCILLITVGHYVSEPDRSNKRRDQHHQYHHREDLRVDNSRGESNGSYDQADLSAAYHTYADPERLLAGEPGEHRAEHAAPGFCEHCDSRNQQRKRHDEPFLAGHSQQVRERGEYRARVGLQADANEENGDEHPVGQGLHPVHDLVAQGSLSYQHAG